MVKRRSLDAFVETVRYGQTTEMAIEKIQLPSSQPRRYFDPDKQQQLEQSIKKYGIIEPLIVRSIDGGKYELVAGERRFRAARKIGLTVVAVVVKELTDQQAQAFTLIENLLREDLNPVEETEGIIALLGSELELDDDEIVSLLYQMKNAQMRNNVIPQQQTQVEKVFQGLGMTWGSFVANRLPLLNLPEEILEVLRGGKLEYTKARAIALLKDDPSRQQLLAEAVENNLTLTQIKERIKELQSVPQQPETPQKQIQGLTKRIIKSKLWEKSPKKWKRVQTLLQKMEAILEEE